MSEQGISGGITIGGVIFKLGCVKMGEWLIADVPLFNVHLQLWMLLVTGFILLWFVGYADFCCQPVKNACVTLVVADQWQEHGIVGPFASLAGCQRRSLLGNNRHRPASALNDTVAIDAGDGTHSTASVSQRVVALKRTTMRGAVHW